MTLNIDAEFILWLWRMNSFGNFEVFDANEEPELSGTTLDGAWPSWMIKRDEFDALYERHVAIKRGIYEFCQAAFDGRSPLNARSVPLMGAMIVQALVCKMIVLIHQLLAVYNYYHGVSAPDCGKCSDFLDPETSPSLANALCCLYVVLADSRLDCPERAAAARELYAVSKQMLSILNAMLDLKSEAVPTLRKRLRSFLLQPRQKAYAGTYAATCQAFTDVADEFAGHEGIWERRRAQLVELKAQLAAREAEPKPAAPSASLKGARPRKRIPIKVAAAAFGVSVNTIANWEKGRHCPPEYVGRDVSEADLAEYAELYRTCKFNARRFAQNLAEEEDRSGRSRRG